MTHPLARLPVTALLRLPTAPNRVLVASISRGLAPRLPAGDAQARAAEHGAGFAMIDGYPAVEAKNRVASLAEEIGASLLLVEDDVLADPETWAKALAPVNGPLPVRFATAACRDGSMNTRWHDDGAPLYSGTPFVLLPHPVLAALPKPVFVANEYGIADGALFLRGPSAKGHGSDVHLWHTLRQLKPRPTVELVGHVVCLKHRLNRDSHDLVTPEVVEVVG